MTMPSTKNTKPNKSKTTHLTRSAPDKESGEQGQTSEIENQPPDAVDPLQGHSKARDTNTPLPKTAPPKDEVDEELALTFLTFHHTLERALVQAGYTRAGHTPASVRADWERFARHIEAQFDPDSDEVLQGAVGYLLWNQENLDLRNERLEDSFPWEPSSPHNDIVWISVLIQQTRDRLLHRINFLGNPGSDTAQVTAALFVVEAWARLDPKVEGFIKSGL